MKSRSTRSRPAARSAQAPGRIGGQFQDGVGQCLGIGRRDEETGDSVGDDFWQSFNLRSDDRLSHRHRLGCREAESLPQRRHGEDINASADSGDVALPADKLDDRGHTDRGSQLFQLPAQQTIAGDQEANICPPFLDDCSGTNQEFGPLLLLQPTDKANDDRRPFRGRSVRTAFCGEGLGMQRHRSIP